MPKVYISNEQREIHRFSDFIRGELKRQGKRHADLAEALCISRVQATNKLNNKTAWSLDEIIIALTYLGKSYLFGSER